MSRTRVYIEVWHQPPTVCGPQLAALVRQAGAEPFMPSPAAGTYEVSWEELLEFDPQVVIYAIPGLGTAYAPEAYVAVEGWNRTEAALQKRVYSVDAQRLDLDLMKSLIDKAYSEHIASPRDFVRTLK